MGLQAGGGGTTGLTRGLAARPRPCTCEGHTSGGTELMFVTIVVSGVPVWDTYSWQYARNAVSRHGQCACCWQSVNKHTVSTEPAICSRSQVCKQ